MPTATEAQDQEAKGWGCGEVCPSGDRGLLRAVSKVSLAYFSYIFSYLLFPWE